MKILNHFVILAAIFSSAVIATASPMPNPALVDVHSTNMKLSKLGSIGDHNLFQVTVTRHDDLFDVNEKNGQVQSYSASKETRVILSFDVGPKGDILCNHMPVPLGVSTITVKAKMSVGVSADALKSHSASELVNAFDEGLVAVKLSVNGKMITLPGTDIKVQQITIQESILEIDGHKVKQSTAKQQMIQIYPDGSVHKGKPCDAPMNNMLNMNSAHASNSAAMHHPYMGHHGHSFSAAAHHAVDWYHRQNTTTKLFSAFLFGSLLGLISVAFLRLILAIFLSYKAIRGYRRVEEDPEDGAFLKQVSMTDQLDGTKLKSASVLPPYSKEEEAAAVNQRESMDELPEYQKGYAAVQTEEH